jgi:Cupredoxin-like domain
MSGARPAKPVLIAAVVAALSATAIAGCGHTATVGADRTLRVALTEYQVIPKKVEMSAGALTIIVHNVGKLTHNLVITTASDQRVDGTPPIWPGATRQLSVTLAPGKYTLASTLFSDQALGELGTLTVTS